LRKKLIATVGTLALFLSQPGYGAEPVPAKTVSGKTVPGKAVPVTKAAPKTAPKAPAADPYLRPADPKKLPFNKRIFVVPPLFGHAPVRPKTIKMAQDVVNGLPKHIYDLLDKGGATINLAPNIIDKWPGSGDGHRPGPLDIVMGEEIGHCYDRDVYLYEAPIVRGTTKLRRYTSDAALKENLYLGIGHAIDDCYGIFSIKPPVPGLYYADIDAMPENVRQDLIEFSIMDQGGCSMTCSELIGLMLGSNYTTQNNPLDHFPRTTKYLRDKLKLHGYKRAIKI